MRHFADMLMQREKEDEDAKKQKELKSTVTDIVKEALLGKSKDKKDKKGEEKESKSVLGFLGQRLPKRRSTETSMKSWTSQESSSIRRRRKPQQPRAVQKSRVRE